MSKTGFKNIKPGKSNDDNDLTQLLSELNEFLPKFVTSSIFKRDIFEKSDEDHYTEILIKFLENENKESRFGFKQQASLPDKFSIDIGVHLKANSEHYFFNIEAKFLPPKDYVTGKCAAIKRFKLNQHGLSHRNPKITKPLSQSAVVAYSKKGIFENHLAKINNKISKLANSKLVDKFGLNWNESEHLQKIEFDESAKLQSKHHRVNNPPIVLYHYWVHI